MNIDTLKQLFAAQLATNSELLFFIAESNNAMEILKVETSNLESLIGVWEVSKTTNDHPDMPRLSKVVEE